MAMRVVVNRSSLDDEADLIRQIGIVFPHTAAIEPIAEGHENLSDKPGNSQLSPGDFVRHPGRPDWGLGQVQSMIGNRITVNFENAGKLLIDGNVVELVLAEPGPAGMPPR